MKNWRSTLWITLFILGFFGTLASVALSIRHIWTHEIGMLDFYRTGFNLLGMGYAMGRANAAIKAEDRA